MTDGPDADGFAAAAAARENRRIRAEIEASLAQLTQLKVALAAARQELESDPARQLVEANANLVIAALAAQRASATSERTVREMTSALERDPVTGLPGMVLMRSRIAAALQEAAADGKHVALLLLHLTDFKLISDTLGVVTADQVLGLVARRLSGVIGPGSMVSRHRGHEFMVLLPQLADVSEALQKSTAAAKAVAAPAMLNDHVLRLAAVVGISGSPDDGCDADSLIAAAIVAMAGAQQRGLGRSAFHGEADSAERSPELRSLGALRSPLLEAVQLHAEPAEGDAVLREANTQLVLAAISAQELKDAAEQVQRRQASFLGVLAHELRNPLMPIRNAAAILGRIPSDSPMLARVQGIIERQVDNISRLVEDLLDVSRVNAGKLRLQKESLDIVRLSEEVAQACRPTMEARSQLFEVRLPEDALRVDGDPVRLTQILGNLLDNASKYTPLNGEIRLSVAAAGQTVVLTVVDNGIGISPEALPTIFEPFVQEQHATLFNGAGLGIGLTVVRELVEGHGGRAEAFSDGKGLGSRFVVTLPLEPPPA
jgi:diguanylate cyclase (GGDEF)-like protein